MMLSRSIAEALQEAASFLRSRGVSSPRLEAELLLAFVLKKERLFFYGHGEGPVSRRDLQAFRLLVKRRGARVPLAYLIGEKEFMGLSLAVEEGVLIPRPETEHLVETVVSWAEDHDFPGDGTQEAWQILDLGVGSGNIALSLLVLLPFSRVTGIDIEGKAVELARRNGRRLGVGKRLKVCRGNYWEALGEESRSFHIIVSNPPYIPTPLLPLLQEEVCREPRLALDGGEDGLDAYRAIIGPAPAYLRLPGLLALEVGEAQAGDVCALAKQHAGFFREPVVQKDYAGIPRLVLLERRA